MDCLNQQPLSEQEIEILKEVFNLITEDESVGVTASDLRKAMISLGYNPTEDECQDVIVLINEDDQEEKTMIYFSRLLSLMSLEKDNGDINAKKEMEEVFNAFDRDHSGFIDRAELRRVMLSVGDDISEKEACDMMQLLQSCDHADVGGIDYEQFLLLMTS